MWKKWIGILLSLLAALSLSLMLVVTKLLLPHLHPITQIMLKQPLDMIIITIMILGFRFIPFSKNESIWKGIIDVNQSTDEGPSPTTTTIPVKIHWNMIGKIMGIGVLASIRSISRFTALNYLNIADATVLTYLSLVFVLILSHFILHEQCLKIQSFLVGFIILGTFIIARPPFLTGGTEFDMPTLTGLGIKIIDSVITALLFILLRYLRTLHFAPMTLMLSITGFIGALSMSFVFNLFKLPQSLHDILLLSALSCLTTITHISLILALKFERASTVCLLRCAEIPFAFIWQIIIFHSMPDTWTWIGTLFVGIGVLLTCLTKLVAELPKESPRRKQFLFFLK